jgi:hypothetical protein
MRKRGDNGLWRAKKHLKLMKRYNGMAARKSDAKMPAKAAVYNNLNENTSEGLRNGEIICNQRAENITRMRSGNCDMAYSERKSSEIMKYIIMAYN